MMPVQNDILCILMYQRNPCIFFIYFCHHHHHHHLLTVERVTTVLLHSSGLKFSLFSFLIFFVIS